MNSAEPFPPASADEQPQSSIPAGPKTLPKPATIRPGQRKPYAKATRQQIEERTQAAALLLFFGFGRTAIHRLFRKKLGVEWRQTDRYMARARVRAQGVSR
jgi:hypothetical protein